MSPALPRMKPFTARLLSALAAAAVVSLVVVSGLTVRADGWAYDVFTPSSFCDADDRIVLVEIDDRSLAELGRWPWSRRTHAQMIDRLTAAGTRGVGLNLLLSEPALFDPEGDALLARALGKNGKVVLPVYSEAMTAAATGVELVPIPEFAASAVALGYVDVPVEADGVARSLFLHAGLGSPRWPSLALALQQTGDPAQAVEPLPGLRSGVPGDLTPQRWVRDDRVLIPQIAAADEFRRVSYADVLNGRIADSELRDKWVLIGATAAAAGDAAAAPEDAARSSSLHYLANALNALAQGNTVVPFSFLQQLLLSLALVALPLLLCGLRILRKPWWPVLAALVLTPLVSLLLLRSGHLWFAPMPAMLVLVLALLGYLLYGRQLMRWQGQADPLTGLANRLRFDDQLEQELRIARRDDQPLSLLVLDVDHFKRFNETLGHAAGDEVLRTLAKVLSARARRPRDLVARLGGDKFAILLPETTTQAAAAIATTLHVDLASLPKAANGDQPLGHFTASIGLHTSSGSDALTPADLFERADGALYRAKEAGRNRSVTHTGEYGSNTH